MRLLSEFLTLLVASAIALSCGQQGDSKLGASDTPGITTTTTTSTLPEPSTPTTLVREPGEPSTTSTVPSSVTTSTIAASPAQAERASRLRPRVSNSFPHDPAAFTQGLVWNGGELFESTGLRGRSSLRRVNLETGEVLQRASLDSSLFAEGLEKVGDRLIQLTWQANTALVYDATTFERTGSFAYPTEGWGLCLDNQNRFVMSDGTSTLYFRDPVTFEEIGSVPVTLNGAPLERLNELECVNGEVYANVWLTNTIVKIDSATGAVVAEIDAAGLLSEAEAAGADVLNGIAYRPETATFLITGKNWPTLFEVTFE